MDEQTLEPHAGFDRLQGVLRDLIGRLVALDPRRL
jgi:hypothetical protein